MDAATLNATTGSVVHFPLRVSAAQAESLQALQRMFAAACNQLAPLVRTTRCWNRVALHHLTYKALREQFPQLGSQMACNAIYSVCRSARIIYQHPHSPWNIMRQPDAPLPLLNFLPGAPVYFDRHTLSVKAGRLSMFTLDGRLHFHLELPADVVARFGRARLREIALTGQGEAYAMRFVFGDTAADTAPDASAWEELPEYLIVLAAPAAEPAPEPLQPPERLIA